MKIIKVFFHYVLLLSISFCISGCEKDYKFEDDDDIAEYYIKYKIKSTNLYGVYLQDVSIKINTEAGYKTLYFNRSNREWEQTFGPVKKGFNSNIKAKDPFYNISTMEIYVCRGQEPFVLKASLKRSNQEPELSYKIDF